jgi:hypothetical protein
VTSNYSATTINLTGTFRGKACLQVISETDGKASAGQVLRSLNSHCDEQLSLRLAIRANAEGGNELWRKTAAGWQHWQSIPMADALTTQPVALDKTGEQLYLIDSRGRDTGALTQVDLHSGEQVELAADPQSDAGAVLIHPQSKALQAVQFTHARQRWHLFDPSLADDFAYLASVVDGDFTLVGRSLDDSR